MAQVKSHTRKTPKGRQAIVRQHTRTPRKVKVNRLVYDRNDNVIDEKPDSGFVWAPQESTGAAINLDRKARMVGRYRTAEDKAEIRNKWKGERILFLPYDDTQLAQEEGESGANTLGRTKEAKAKNR